MSQNDSVSFDFVKKSVSIVQVLDRYHITHALKKKGENFFVGPCPFHGGTTTFLVSRAKNTFICDAPWCQAQGNIVDFVCRKERVPLQEAANLIHRWFRLKPALQPIDEEKIYVRTGRNPI